MNKLDCLETLKEFDEKGVLSSIKMLANQARQAWEEVSNLKLNKKFAGCKNVVICGMGGSALGGRIVDSLIEKKIRAPIEIFTQYYLPNYVNKDTLVLLSSYSGDTEEILTCAHDALKRNAKIFMITTGGKLADFLKKEKLDGYVFEPTYNPSKMPRLAIGYSIFTILAFLNKTHFITITEEEIKKTFDTLEESLNDFGPRKAEKENLAKKIANGLIGKMPVIISSEHLIGAAHLFKNQFNETSKTFSASFDLPELNHHLMEGLKLPPKAKEILRIIFIKSSLYSERVVKRYPLTEDVVEKNSVSHSVYILRSETKLEQVFELIAFSSFVTFYLAVLTGANPSEIPWVDYFKSKLAKS